MGLTSSNERGQRGVALIAVLWALVLLALIAATVLKESRTQSRLARNLLEAARAEALADAGVHRAMAGLAKPVSAGGWRSDGTVYSWTVEGADVRIRIEDEGGKFDLNRIGGVALRNLFLAAGVPAEAAGPLADSIEDFRDSDDERRPEGAEDEDYLAAGRSYGAKDRPFEALEELHQVLGMTRSIYAAVAPALTVHSRRRRPDRRVAPALVIAALQGGADSRAEAVGVRDQAGDAAVEGASGLQDNDVRILFLGPTPRRSGSRTYTIHSQARTTGGGHFARRAVIRVPGQRGAPFEILAWGRSETALFGQVSK